MTNYCWWECSYGNEPGDSSYLKLGPITFCAWSLAEDWFLDVNLFNRWYFTI